MYIISPPTAVTHCTFIGNTAAVNGGGLYNHGIASTSYTHCTIIGNSAGNDGGGIYNQVNHATFTNCVIAGNTASVNGGGVCNYDRCGTTFTNCTFSGNSATFGSGGGMYNDIGAGPSNPRVTNCILWGDFPDEIANDDCNPNVNYSDVEGGWPGDTNIDEDPLFISLHGFDYLLDVGSPCIDMGNPLYEDGISDWHPRWPEWYPNGSRADMGAYGGPGNKGWLAYRGLGIPVDTNWRQYGFDCQNTGYNPYETVLSPTTVGELQVDWTRSFGPSIYSNPAVVDGVVYMGTYYNNVYALNAETGETIWSQYTDGTTSGPAVVDGIVYVGSRHSPMIYALDAETGEIIWTSTIGGSIVGGSPTVVDGVVFIGAQDGKLYALDTATGDVLWSAINSDDRIFTPSVGSNMVYVSSLGDLKLYALDVETGSVIWTATLGHWIKSPAVADGIVYAGAADGNLYALDALTGEKSWSAMTGGNEVYAPAIANGVVYVGADDHALYAFDIDTHELLWSATTRGTIEGIPTVANGVVYVAETPGPFYAYAFDAATGDLLWEYDLGSNSAPTSTSPTVVDGRMYVSATFDYAIYAFHLPE
jgi:parallel beta-helix repeat protein/predicted outer membrane repeat protein